MVSSPTELEEIVRLAPEWQATARRLAEQMKPGVLELFNQLGAKAIFQKALSLSDERQRFITLTRDRYLQPHILRMLVANENFRRFSSQRRVPAEEQRRQAMSFSIDLAQKMESVLVKQLAAAAEDGFKVLLPAYIQRTVHNAVIDYIRQEWSWERQTLQDLHLDPEQDDPRQAVADDARQAPENLAISKEQVGQLNQLRRELEKMLADKALPREPLVVIDCMFGLGLTESSVAGEELTMRECCDRLNIGGETQARRIARCQVLLDKGLDLIRGRIREKLPGIAESWQGSTNVNSASRRELAQHLGMTEGEVERLIDCRQYSSLEELVERAVVKPNRLPELASRGAVAAFVPVDLNTATVRDMIDIVGIAKEAAQKIAAGRPFRDLSELAAQSLIDRAALDKIRARGAVVKASGQTGRIDLNRAEAHELTEAGLPAAVAERVVFGRPFLTWTELEDYLGCDPALWAVLRGKFRLGLASG